MNIIACYSSKGGVGKTSTATNLAFVSAARGQRTLLVDLDQQGASTFYFRVRPPDDHRAKDLVGKDGSALHAIRETDYDRLHLLPAHASYRNFDALLDGMKRSKRRLADLLQELSGSYDVLLLDCPPSMGLVAENVFRAADLILVPVIPTTLSRRTFDQLNAFFEGEGYERRKLRPFFSMVERRKRMHRDIMRDMRAREPRLLQTCIPFSAEIEAMGTHREPVLCYSLKGAGGVAFLDLWLEVEKLRVASSPS